MKILYKNASLVGQLVVLFFLIIGINSFQIKQPSSPLLFTS